MSRLGRATYRTIYRRAAGPEALPWHRDEPLSLALDAARGRGPLRVLDLGCGSGVDAVALAAMGHRVTAVDREPRALEMTRARAARAGVEVETVRADVLRFAGSGYDLVVDAGCLHTMGEPDRRRYRERLAAWLAPGGEYVLLHFLRRHPLDWRPFGPRRLDRDDLVAAFAPLLAPLAWSERDVPTRFPVGPVVRLGTLRFRARSGA